MAHGDIHGPKHGPVHGVKHGELTLSNFLTIWIFGQSNSMPRANKTSITNRFGFTASYPNVQYIRRSAPSAADPPVFTDEGPAAVAPTADLTENVGLDISMARWLDDVLPRQVRLLIGPSVAGGGLHDRFRTDVVYPTVGPNLHTQVKAFAQEKSGIVGRPDVIVLMQGETDATDAVDAAAFQTDLTNEINSLRTLFPDIPVVLGEIGTPHATYTELATIRAAMVSVAGTLSSVTIVDTDDLALNGPDHYTADSFMILGERLADACLAAVGQPRVRWTSAVTGGSGLQITFTYTGTGATPTSYLWTFGDGTTSTAQNPVKTYSASGRYTVTCTAYTATKAHTLSRDRVAVNPSGRWTVDATSNKARPANTSEEANLVTDSRVGIGAADHIYLLQEASGNAVDSKGSKTLTVGNTPLFQQAVAGWSTFFITGSGVATTQSHVNATMPNANANRVAALTYCTWNASGASNRALMNRGAAGHVELTSSGGTSKARFAMSGSTARITVADHAGTVLPYLIWSDSINQRAFMASSIEPPVEVTWSSFSATDFRLTYSLSSDISAINKHNFAKVWDAVPINMTNDEVRCLFESHGWDCSW